MNINKIKEKVMAYLNMEMAEYIRENGKKENKMVQAHLLKRIKVVSVEIGLMALDNNNDI